MKLEEDYGKFDPWQAHFSFDLLQTIKDCLDKAGLPAEQVQELTTAIGFHVSCLIDGAAEFSVGGQVIVPYLTFSVEDGVLVHQGSPSDLHDYAHGNAGELFES